jgi:hypothetical protein
MSSSKKWCIAEDMREMPVEMRARIEGRIEQQHTGDQSPE